MAWDNITMTFLIAKALGNSFQLTCFYFGSNFLVVVMNIFAYYQQQDVNQSSE